MFVYINDQFLQSAKAVVSVDNRSFRYGDGCFETMKLANGKLLQAQWHMDRLFYALQILKFEVPAYFTAQYLVEKVETLAAKNQHTALARIRLTIFRGEGGLYDAVNLRPNVCIQSWELPNQSNLLNENGLVLDIFKDGHKACDALANIKCNNFLLYALAALQAKKDKCNDMIVLNQYGRIADSTIANVWMVKQNEIFTPPLSEGCVQGTMRAYLLQQLKIKGFSVQEFPITIEALQQADEVFLTNAIQGVKWVKQIGGFNYSLNVATTLHAQFIKPLG